MMMEAAQGTPEVEVVPELEVALKTFRLSAGDETARFVGKYTALGHTGSYLETPDGWFFPLRVLLPDLRDLAGFLIQEASQVGELEVYGGLAINAGPIRVPSLRLGSSFRLAVPMIDVVTVLGSGERDLWRASDHLNLWVDNDHFIAAYSAPERTVLRWAYEGGGEAAVDTVAFQEHMRVARHTIEDFVQQIEPLLLAVGVPTITSDHIRWQFGLARG